MTKSKGKGRGFASLSRAQREKVSRAGGRAAWAAGHAHVFTSEEARAAAAKGRAMKKAKE